MDTLTRPGKVAEHRTAQTTGALYVVHAARIIVPLALIPYLTHVLGVREWGVVAAAYSFALWTQLVVEYSFIFSASREVARLRNDPSALSGIVSSVQGTKFFLTTLSVLPAIGLALLADLFYGRGDYIFYAWVLGVAQAFSPMFYFQGIERVVFPAAVEVITRGLSVAAIFIFVQTPSDGAWALAAPGLAAGCAAVMNNRRMYNGLAADSGSLGGVVKRVVSGFPLFAFRLGCSVFAILPPLLLSFFSSPAQVGLYAIAEKGARAAQQSLFPAIQGVYPRIAYLAGTGSTKEIRNVRLVALGGAAVLSSVVALLVWQGAGILPLVLGSDYDRAASLLSTMAWVIPITTLRETLTIHWLMPGGHDVAAAASSAIGAATLVCFVVGIFPISGAMGMVYAVIAGESLAGIVVLIASVAISLPGRKALPDIVKSRSI